MIDTAVTPAHVRRSWRALFDDQREAEALARLFAQSQAMREGRDAAKAGLLAGSETVVLHPRALRGAGVVCRGGTTDAEVFDDTFVGLYHLPPVELGAAAVVLDLGGNAGYTAAHFAALVPGGRVICVEMDAGNAAAARKNVQAFGERCVVVHAAAWPREGEVVYEGTEAWGYRIAVLEGATPTPAGEQKTVAPARPVESILRELGVGRVDYAKVDIEGAEAEVVTPDAPWLRLVRTIKVEYHEPATRESMAQALEAAGFAVRDDDTHPRCVVGIRTA